MKIKVYFHGHLKEKIKKDFLEVEATTVYDALKNIAGKYQKQLKAPLDIGRWKVKVKDYDTKESWYVPIFTNELHIYPIFKTAKSQWTTIAIGVALVAVTAGAGAIAGAVATGIGASSATVSAAVVAGNTFAASAMGTFITNVGVSLILSGICNLLFPTPKMNTSQEAQTNSKYLNGSSANTAAAGTRIPFGYGLFRVSGHYISYNISTTTVRVVDFRKS